MPSSRPASTTVVLLTEVLEVRGKALDECQIWSLLYQSAEVLHDITLSGETLDEGQPVIYVMPETVSLLSDGSIRFEQCPRQTFEQSKYCSFEWQAGIADSTDPVAVEKMWTYALGMTAYTSADYDLRSDEALNVAEALSSCLSVMVEHQADRRCTLLDVIEACFKYANKHMAQPFCHYTQAMYKSVLGSPPNEVVTLSLMDYVSLRQLTRSPFKENRGSRANRKREAPDSDTYKLDDIRSSHEWTFPRRKYRSTGLPPPEPLESHVGLQRNMVDPALELIASHSAAYQHVQSNSPLWEIFGSLGSTRKPLGEGLSTESFLRAAYERIIDRRKKLLFLSEGLGENASSSVVDRGNDTGLVAPPDMAVPASKAATSMTEESTSGMSASAYSSTTSLTHGSFYPTGQSSATVSMEETDPLAATAADIHGDPNLVESSAEITPSKNGSSSPRRQVKHITEEPVIHEEQVYQKQQHTLESSRLSKIGPTKPVIGTKMVHLQTTSPTGKQQRLDGVIPSVMQLPDAITVPQPPEPSATSVQHQKEPMAVKKKKPLRAFTGPEPVFNAGQPIREIPFYIPGKQKGKVASVISSPTLHKSVMVTLLTGEKIRLHCTGSSTGGQIFKAIVEEMDMKEQYYFGLTYIKDNEHFFIDEDTKLHKVAPDYWKKDAPSSFGTLSLYMRVKYYAENIQSLRQIGSRHSLYLQLRADVIEERLLADSDDVLMLLAGVALQAEYGDHADAQSNASYFLVQHYVPLKVLRRQHEGQWRTALVAIHARNAGLSKISAESKFVEICQRMQEYGVHFYRVFATEMQAVAAASTLPIGEGHHSGLVWLGLSVKGLVLCETRDPGRAPCTMLAWSGLQKFSFNRKKVTIVTQVSMEKPKATKTSYFTDGYRKAKYLVSFAATLQRYRRQTVTLSQGTHVSVTAVGELPGKASEMVWTQLSEDHQEVDATESTVKSSNQHDGTSPTALKDATDAAHGDRTKVVTTILEKDPETGSIGINLVGINDRLKRGIFVAEVMRRGPLDTKINVKVGDRIIAINGQVIEGTSRGEAIDLIKTAGGQVQLVLSRTMTSTQESGSQLTDAQITKSPERHRNAHSIGSTIQSPQYSEPVPRAHSHDKRVPTVDEVMQSPVVADEWPADSASNRTSPGELSEQLNAGNSSDDGEPQPKVTRHMPQSSSAAYDTSSVSANAAEDSFSVASAFQKPAPKQRATGSLKQLDDNRSPSNIHDEDAGAGQSAVDLSPVERKLSRPQFNTAHGSDTPEKHIRPTHQGTDERQASALSKAKQKSSSSSSTSSSVKKSASRRSHPRSGVPDEASSDEEVSVVMAGPSAKHLTSRTKPAVLTDLASRAAVVATNTVVGSPATISTASLRTPVSDNLKVGDKYEVILAKTSGTLGLNVTGGTNTSVKLGGIYVKSMVPGGPAEACTIIHLGDRVLSVNGIDLTAVTHRLAVETLRNAEAPVQIILERGDPPVAVVKPPTDSQTAGLQMPSSPDTRPSSEGTSLNQPTISPVSTSESMGEIRSEGTLTPLAPLTQIVTNNFLLDAGIHFEVLLTKEPSGFGFSILGGRTPGVSEPKKSLLRVKKIFPLGAAAKEGSLQVGDVIMGVDNQSLEGFTHADAVNLLRSCTQKVKLSVCRVDARVLSPLTESMVNAPSRHSSAVSPAMQVESPKLALAQMDADVDDTNSLSTADRSTSSIESEITVVTPGATKHPREQSVISQPTPIRELDDILQANTMTSMHASGSETPHRAASQRNSGRRSHLSQWKASASGVLPASLADRLRMAMSNSEASSRRSSMSDGPGADRRLVAVEMVASEPETSRTEAIVDIASLKSPLSVPAEMQLHEKQVIDVTLRKNENGSLGFSVMGGVDGGCFVKAILQNPALADGRLHAGDRLLMANGKDMTDMTAAAAVQYLRQAPETVNIRIERSSPDGAAITANPLALPTMQLALAGADPDLSTILPTTAGGSTALANGHASGTTMASENDFLRRSSSSLSSGSNNGPELENMDSISFTSSSSKRSVGDGCETDAVDAGLLPLDFAKHVPAAQQLPIGSRSVTRGPADEAADPSAMPSDSGSALESTSPHGAATVPSGGLESLLADGAHPDEPKDRVLCSDSAGPVDVVGVFSLGTPASSAPRQRAQEATEEEKQEKVEEEKEEGHERPERDHRQSTEPEVSSYPPPTQDSHRSNDEASRLVALFPPVADDDVTAAIARRESIRLLPTEDVIRVSLTKPSGGGLGFSINCEEQDGHLYAFVKAITPGGVAEADGRLHAGDRLLKVNDVNIAGYTQPKAVALIRQLQGIVQLVLARQHPASPVAELSPEQSEQSSSEEDVSVLLASSLRSATDGESTDIAKELSDSGRVLLSTLSSGTDGKEGPNMVLTDANVKGTAFSDDSSDDDHSPASDLDFDLPDDSNTSTGRASASLVETMPHGSTQQRLDIGLASSAAKGARSSGQESTEDAHDSDDSLSEILQKHFSLSATGAQSPLLSMPSLALSVSDDVEDELSDTHEQQKPTNVTSGPKPRRSNQSSPWYGGESVGIPLFGRHVVAEWVSSLPFVKVGAKGLYTGSALERTLAQLRIKIANDDPSEEFKAMKNIKPTDDCHEGKAPQNKSLNRFRNVLPYNFNRVILYGDDDYINASHIRIPLGEDMSHYIACQGPLPQTTPHFWQMIVEQKVQVIAMLTLDVENGKVKCHRYWPDSPDTPLVVSDRYQVSLGKAYQMEHFDVRYITVRDQFSSMVHQTVHLNYKTWPDRGVPKSAQPLLQFLRVMHEFHVSGPVVLHCSAGIGRTGAVIALDIIMSCMEKDLKFDINQIIVDLRKQRQGMIQTKDQYLFCYDASIQAMELVK